METLLRLLFTRSSGDVLYSTRQDFLAVKRRFQNQPSLSTEPVFCRMVSIPARVGRTRRFVFFAVGAPEEARMQSHRVDRSPPRRVLELSTRFLYLDP